MSAKRKVDVYGMVTDRIVAQLEKGVVPWHRPWSGGGAPMNIRSKKSYHGMNVFLLGGYSSPWWGSLKQVNEMGGRINAGEKSSLCVYWKWFGKKSNSADGEVDDDSDDGVRRPPLLFHYSVFNIEQTTLRDDPRFKVEAKVHEPIREAEAIAHGMPDSPVVLNVESRAYYRPSSDTVNVPAIGCFESPEEYYSTLFHELAHSTGHERRLGRAGVEDVAAFGGRTYSQEELVAEMSAAFLCGACGIVDRTLDNSAAYIGNWLKRLKDDRRLLMKAAGQAQKASDFILGVRYDDDAKAVKDDVPVVVSNIEEKMLAMTSNLSAAGRAVGVLVCRGFAEDVAVRCVAARMGGLNVDLVLGEYRGARW